ncbi:MAG TPA: MarR family transcriptional regulator [Candidatus Limnocylindrales bacterium]|jgi:DNA-binding MarR family transcriptional regulator
MKPPRPIATGRRPAGHDQVAAHDIIADIDEALGELRCAGSQQLLRAGVSMAHLHVMWMLRRHGALSMTRLADSLDVSLSNATGLIDRMAERGLIERVRVADDRRVVLVTLSDHGRAMLVQADVLRADLLETILSHLDADQLARVGAAVADIRSAVSMAQAAGELPAVDHHRDLPAPASRPA